MGSVLYVNRNPVAMKAGGNLPPSWGWIIGMNIIGVAPAPGMLYCNGSKHTSLGAAPALSRPILPCPALRAADGCPSLLQVLLPHSVSS